MTALIDVYRHYSL